MKPVRLEIENLRSFRTKRVIDFNDVRLCAIIGDTGAGKTSILEAITYALYDRSTWSGRDVKQLISSGARQMCVTFVFVVDGHEYTVMRITRVNGGPTHRLVCPTRGLDVSGRNVTDEIKAALHLNDDTFLHTVLLPQGKHAELLVADKGDRQRMLGELFRLDQIIKVGELAKDQTTRVEAVLDARRRDRGADGEDLEGRLAEAQQRVAETVQALERAQVAVAEAQELDATIAAQTLSISGGQTRIAQISDTSKHVAELRSLKALDSELRAQLSEASHGLGVAQSARDQANAALQRLVDAHRDSESVNCFKIHLESSVNELDERQEEQKLLDLREAERPGLIQTLAEKQQAKKDADQALADARGAVTEAEKHAKVLNLKVNALDSALRDLRRDVATANEAQKIVESRRGAVVRIESELADALRTLREAQTTAEAATERLGAANVAAGAAALATHLHAGDDCPVCRRELPESFVPPGDVDVTEAAAHDKVARKALTAATQSATTLEAQLAGAKTHMGEAEAALRQASEQAVRARAAVDALVPRGEADAEQTLAQMKHDSAAADSAIDAGRLHANAVTAAAIAAAKNETQAASALTALDQQIAELRARIAGRDKTYAQKSEQLPVAFRPLTEDAVGIATARATIEEALTMAREAQNAYIAANKAVADAQAEVTRLESDRLARVLTPRVRAVSLLNNIASLLGLPTAPNEETQWDVWVDATEAAARNNLDATKKIVDEATGRRDAAQVARTSLAVALGCEPAEAVTLAAVAKRDAERDIEAIGGRIQQRKHLEAKIAEIEPVYLGIKTIKDEMRSTRFQAYATEQRQERLLFEGSRLLKEMSDDRYQFTRDFQIFDALTNQARSAQTLSGGEKFLASLALSLAVVEIAANSGAKIGSLFLDEGFASLDSDWVETSMMELRRRARQGRSICVISHLAQVAQFVDTTFRVEATVDGSKVEVIEGSIAQDSAAIEGLLLQLAPSI